MECTPKNQSQFLMQRSHTQAQLASAMSKKDYKRQLLEAVSRLSDEDEDKNMFSTFSSSKLFQYSQDPYEDTDMQL